MMMKDIWSKKSWFLHHISLHLLLPNFFPSKTEDYLEKFTTMQAETKWLILEGKLTKIPFCLCLSFIFCPRKVFRWEESVKLLNAEVTLKCMSKKKSEIHSTHGGHSDLQNSWTYFFLWHPKYCSRAPNQKICWFLFPLQSKAFFGCHGIFFYKKKQHTYVLSKDKVGLWYYCH